jgi:hypothetical protein
MSKNLDKLKQFFRTNKASGGQERIHVLNNELERELRKDNSLEKRLRLIKELGEIALGNRLEEVSWWLCSALTSSR